jgi:Holliday junction resolvase RusA-like endonuclease
VAFLLLGKRPARGRNGNTYNPSKKDQKILNRLLLLQWAQRTNPNTEGVAELHAEIKFCFPKKASKIKAVSPPDLDNLAKFVLDAVGKLFYDDDAQISRLVLEKGFSDAYGGKGFTSACFANRVIDIED